MRVCHADAKLGTKSGARDDASASPAALTSGHREPRQSDAGSCLSPALPPHIRTTLRCFLDSMCDATYRLSARLGSLSKGRYSGGNVALRAVQANFSAASREHIRDKPHPTPPTRTSPAPEPRGRDRERTRRRARDACAPCVRQARCDAHSPWWLRSVVTPHRGARPTGAPLVRDGEARPRPRTATRDPGQRGSRRYGQALLGHYVPIRPTSIYCAYAQQTSFATIHRFW